MKIAKHRHQAGKHIIDLLAEENGAYFSRMSEKICRRAKH